MRQTPVDDYLEEISTELPEELYGNLSDAIYETVCEFDEEVAQLKDENAKLSNEVDNLLDFEHLTSVAVDYAGCDECGEYKQTMLRLFDENAKLREHLNELLMIGSFGSCRRDCRYVDDCLADRFGQPDCFVCQGLQELGIEVN